MKKSLNMEEFVEYIEQNIDNETIPYNIDEQFEICQKMWPQFDPIFRCSPRSSFDTTHMNKIANYLIEYFANIEEVSILEPFAGDGTCSQIIRDHLSKTKNFNNLKSTDICDYDTDLVEPHVNSVETVRRYGKDFNVLMMIKPPPNGFSDYFAIREWEKLNNAEYIVIAGEYSRGDGSLGMLKYMIENQIWKLSLRETIQSSHEIFGITVKRELFIFKRD